MLELLYILGTVCAWLALQVVPLALQVDGAINTYYLWLLMPSIAVCVGVYVAIILLVGGTLLHNWRWIRHLVYFHRQWVIMTKDARHVTNILFAVALNTVLLIAVIVLAVRLDIDTPGPQTYTYFQIAANFTIVVILLLGAYILISVSMFSHGHAYSRGRARERAEAEAALASGTGATLESTQADMRNRIDFPNADPYAAKAAESPYQE